MSFTHVPKDFQKELFKNISEKIKKGESVQIFGAPGSGNSLVVKSLVQSVDIRNEYFGKEYSFLLLDANMLLERTSLGLSRLMIMLLSPNGNMIVDSSLLQSEIEERMSDICRTGKLVLIIDHMQELGSQELLPFFINIYGAYRKLEPKFNFIFVFRNKINAPGDVKNFGPLGRLITQNILHTPCFDRDDCFWFIEEKVKQTGVTLKDKDKTLIFRLSGGFPRTVKRLVESAGRRNLNELENDPAIDPAFVGHLEELLDHPEELPEIPILKKYIENISKGDGGELLGGIKFETKLTKNEEKLLKIFLTGEGEIIEREKGIESLWGERAIDVSDHAYDQIILRLRKKLRNSSPKADVKTVKGRGHVFKMSDF